MTGAPMGEQHDWCGMALYAVRQLPPGDPWTVRTFAVVDAADLRGEPNRAGQKLRRAIEGMQAPVAEPLPTWTSGELSVLRGVMQARTGGPERPTPVLVAGVAALTDVPTQLLGFTATKPIMGLVVVVRGYVTVHGTAGGPVAAAAVWQAGGRDWPAEGGDAGVQPAVAAFAVDRRSGASAMLAHRVAAPGQQLPPGADEQFIDLSSSGLTFATLAENPWLSLEAACGKRPTLPPELLGDLPRPGWLLGRWMLHEAFVAAQLHADDPATEVVLPRPPLSPESVTWAAVRADQTGARRLGGLLSDAEARLLPDLLLAEECIARSPAQAWLWRHLEEQLGDDDGRALLEALRVAWERWPQLHEPAHFLGAAASTFR